MDPVGARTGESFSPPPDDLRGAPVEPVTAARHLILERRRTRREVTYLDAALRQLWERGGSDLLLTVGREPLARVEGELLPVRGYAPMTAAEAEETARALLDDDQWAAFAGGAEIDFSFTWGGGARIRGNVFRQRGAVAMALRMIPEKIPSFDALGVPPAVRRLAERRQGMVFVTGPTGSGKSSTLASIIGWINQNRRCHILTIEDPIEYVHGLGLAAMSQREVGADTATFGTALRSALRESPDVILVGEMRDLESIQFALTLAETGHLVFATLHTNDTSSAVDRLVDVFPPEQQAQVRVQLAHSLSAVVFQRLVPRVSGGVVAAYEVLIATAPVRNLIKEGKTSQMRNQLVTGQREGSQTLEQSLNALQRGHIISHADAMAFALHPG